MKNNEIISDMISEEVENMIHFAVAKADLSKMLIPSEIIPYINGIKYNNHQFIFEMQDSCSGVINNPEDTRCLTSNELNKFFARF